jgi:hypothetical protein
MKNLNTRLKKLEQIKGSAFILYPYFFGSDLETIEASRFNAEKKYLTEGGDPYIEKIFIGIVEFGHKINESKWSYSL